MKLETDEFVYSFSWQPLLVVLILELKVFEVQIVLL